MKRPFFGSPLSKRFEFQQAVEYRFGFLKNAWTDARPEFRAGRSFDHLVGAGEYGCRDVKQLLQLRDDVGKELNRKSTELRSQLARLGTEIASSRGRGSLLKGKKVPPKYRDNAGNTWAGRGAKPRWLVAATKEGKKLEDFAVEKTARKRRAKKK
jgi:DNA-binding protein H-NS